MSNTTDDALHDMLRSGLDAELDDLPDAQVLWWRAYREERESLMAKAILPMNLLAAPLEAAACFAPTILIAVGALRGYFPLALGSLAALLAMVLVGCWIMARFSRHLSDQLLTGAAARTY
jgi:hypothetical protein